jgi:hypothetical protein
MEILGAMFMGSRDVTRLIKNVYDDETLDAIKSFDQNVLALMHHNPIFKHVELDQYARVPVKVGSSDTHIRVDVSRGGVKAFIFLTETYITRINEGEEIRSQLLEAMNRIKVALKL